MSNVQDEAIAVLCDKEKNTALGSNLERRGRG